MTEPIDEPTWTVEDEPETEHPSEADAAGRLEADEEASPELSAAELAPEEQDTEPLRPEQLAPTDTPEDS